MIRIDDCTRKVCVYFRVMRKGHKNCVLFAIFRKVFVVISLLFFFCFLFSVLLPRKMSAGGASNRRKWSYQYHSRVKKRIAPSQFTHILLSLDQLNRNGWTFRRNPIAMIRPPPLAIYLLNGLISCLRSEAEGEREEDDQVQELKHKEGYLEKSWSKSE